MTSVPKSVYIDELDDIVNKYNNTYHRTIKTQPTDVNSKTYINSSKEINDKDPKFKINNIVRISKYKNTFEKDNVPNWSEEVFAIIQLVILMEKNLLERFTKNNCKKQIKEGLELKE